MTSSRAADRFGSRSPLNWPMWCVDGDRAGDRLELGLLHRHETSSSGRSATSLKASGAWVQKSSTYSLRARTPTGPAS
jgi:hypothetical protein